MILKSKLKDEEKMDYFNQILRFTDGSIEPEKEHELFLELSYDDELRSEFKKHLLISTAIKENLGNTNPPASAKSGIFGTIGLALPKESLSGQIPNGYSGFFNRYWLPILSCLITFLLTSVFFIKFYNPEDAFSSDVISGSQKKALVNLSDNNVIAQNTSEVSSKQEVRTITKYKYIYIPVYTTLEKKNNPKENNKSALSNPLYPLIKPAINKNSIKMDISSKKTYPSIVQSNDFNISEPIIYEPIGLGVEIFNSAVRHIPYPDVKPERYMNFTNMGIAIYYNLSNNIKIGADLRQETFHQVYESDDKKYWQQPNFATICGFLRYSINDVGTFHPFAQIEAGANYVGSVLRGQLGVEYSPYPSISFILGGEYSFLSFHHDNRRFSAHKLNLNYGVNLNF